MEKIAYRGKIIEVVQKEVDQNGKTKTFEFARRSPGVRIIAIEKGPDDSMSGLGGDGNNSNRNILLTKEFRHELGRYDYRLPGGKVFDSLDEYNAALDSGIDLTDAARTAAIKEAREEIGIHVQTIEAAAKAEDVTFLHKSVCGTTVQWDLFYFEIQNFERTAQQLEAGEDIIVESFSLEKAKGMCLDGSISEERSALILLRYLSGGLKS